MRRSPRSDGITLATLGFGIAVPLLYYGAQLVAAPFFALTVFVPIGVGAYEVARRIGAVRSGIGGPHEVGAAALPVDESH